MDREIKKSLKLSSFQLPIIIERLERESRKYFYIGLVFGVFILLFANLFVDYEGISFVYNHQDERTINLKLIELPPRIPNPFENFRIQFKPREYIRLQKRPSPNYSSNPQLTPPSKITAPPNMDIAVNSKEMINIADDYADTLNIDQIYSFDFSPDNIIPLKNQLFFDTGQNKTEIIFNPKNKTAIQGYVHFGIGWGKYLTPPDHLRTSVVNLADALKKHTNIEAIPKAKVYISTILPDDYLNVYNSIQNAASRNAYATEISGDKSLELHKYSFLYLNTDKTFTFTESECLNLHKFLRNDGFIIFDNGAANYDSGIIDKNIRENIFRIFHPPGSDPFEVVPNLWFEPLSPSHPVFHSFFDFEDGPPPGSAKSSSPDRDNIIGVFMGGGNQGPLKLICIYTPQGYSRLWQNPQNTEQLKMGVNLVVYALTRYKEISSTNAEGSELISNQRIIKK